MTQTFLFVRHGSIAIQADSTAPLPPLSQRGLLPAGAAEACAAGAAVQAWLDARALRVDRVLLADSLRARQTAALVFAPLPPTQVCPMSPRAPLRQIEGWLDQQGPDAVLARVGHGPAFLATLQALSPAAPDLSKVFGVVLVAVRDPGWRLVAILPHGDHLSSAT